MALTPEQKENSLQVVMLWQARNNTDAQHMTIDTDGQMVMKSKRELKEEFVHAEADGQTQTAVRLP